jgi:phage-related protein
MRDNVVHEDREWLKNLDAIDRRTIGEDIKDVEFSWPIGMPLVRPLGQNIWEVRSTLPRGRIARVLFCIEEDCMVLLHGFMKKTQRTPQADLGVLKKVAQQPIGRRNRLPHHEDSTTCGSWWGRPSACQNLFQ